VEPLGQPFSDRPVLELRKLRLLLELDRNVLDERPLRVLVAEDLYENAIQSAHAQRALNGKTDWEAIALLYEGLLRYAPTIGARVAYAAALAEARAADAGLAALDAIPADAVAAYQPYWALRGHLLKGLGRKAQARAAYDRAIGLSEDPALREFLLRRQRG